MPITTDGMNKEELNWSNFCENSHYEAFLCGKAADMGGGTITKEEIDEIQDYQELRRIAVAGLHQDTFDYFVEKYGDRFKAIYFFKNKMVTDLSVLGKLKNVEVIGYFLNQRAEELWDMSGNTSLKMLDIADFSRLKTLKGIETAPHLQCIKFGNKVWGKSKIEIVPELKKTKLERVSFNSEMSCENLMYFLESPTLIELDFCTNLYKTEFLAWINANFPNIQGYAIGPYKSFRDNSVLVCGKRKPYLYLENEKDRIKLQKYENKFNEMVNEFKGVSLQEMLKILK